MVPQATARSEVLHGFEAGVGLTQRLLREAGHVAILTSSSAAEEFVPGLIHEARAFLARGGQVRLLLLGAPSPEVLALLAESKVVVRLLAERRDFGFLAADTEVLLWPLEQPRHSALQEVTLHVRDPPFLAHVWLAFERAWERGAVPPA